MKIRAEILYLILILIPLGIFGSYSHLKEDAVANVIPHPEKITLSGSDLILQPSLNIYINDAELSPLVNVLDYEFNMITGGNVNKISKSNKAQVHLNIDK
jgi:hypothetical protein